MSSASAKYANIITELDDDREELQELLLRVQDRITEIQAKTSALREGIYKNIMQEC